MSTIEDKCKLKGVRLTDQRKIIAQVSQSQKKNMGRKITLMWTNYINELLEIDDKISIATVYRTVKLFEEAGIWRSMILKEVKQDMKN